jgi:hypothetical protein
MTTIARTFTLVDTTCHQCGVLFAVPDWFDKARREDHQTFHCPNGHMLAYRTSELDKARTELAKTQGQLTRAQGTITHLRDQVSAAERQVSAHKGQVTRLRKRVANGVCPCCSRTFADVARHMATKHPDYAEVES